MDQGRQLLVAGGGSRKRTDPGTQYGFFVRRTTPLAAPPAKPAPDLRVPRTLLAIKTIPVEADAKPLGELAVAPGDMISLVVGPKGTHSCDTTFLELIVTEVGGGARVWNLTPEVINTLLAGNPHDDSQGHGGVWHFHAEISAATPPLIPSQPPLVLGSQAASAREFLTELHARKLSPIRQQTRAHEEQTWDGAVTAMRGTDLPPDKVFEEAAFLERFRGHDLDRGIFSLKSSPILHEALRRSRAAGVADTDKQRKLKVRSQELEVYHTPNGIDIDGWHMHTFPSTSFFMMRANTCGLTTSLFAGSA
ncbi:MAG: hypothetical protein K9N23_12090 [Akkermansiaceae bacterium]|nr:hypothetical protein [Akkermansiaceae bacterium]